MYYDPNGESAILTMVVIGTLIGTASGFLFNVSTQLYKNDWNFSEVDWGSAVNSAIVGGALGFSLSMGVAYLSPLIAGLPTTSGSAALTVFATSTGVSFGAGALGYATEEWINGRTPMFGTAIMHGGFIGLEGIWNFGLGGMIGSMWKPGTKGDFLRTGEWWGKFLIGQEFSLPFNITIDYLRKNI